MSLPFLQVGNELIDHVANDVGFLLGIGEAEAGWMVLKMWNYGVARCHDDDAFDGSIKLGPKSAGMLESKVGWRGDAGEFIRACVTMGLVEVSDSGVRIRGMERYRRALTRRTRPGPSKRRPSAEHPPIVANDAGGLLADESVLTGGQNTPKCRTYSSSSKSSSFSSLKGVQGEEVSFDLAAQLSDARQASCPQAQSSPPRADEFAAWRRDAKEYPDGVLLAAYECFLLNPWARGLTPAPCPWGAWRKKWREFIPGQGSEPPRPAQATSRPELSVGRGRAPAETTYDPMDPFGPAEVAR